jgi:S-adenosylmethionine decarboxylase
MPDLTLTHTHIDVHGAQNLDDAKVVENALNECVRVSGCRLVHLHAHKFPGAGGVSGFALIAESHFSIHTWPEFSFAAVDFFTCGQGDGLKAVPIIEQTFRPTRLDIRSYRRGE